MRCSFITAELIPYFGESENSHCYSCAPIGKPYHQKLHFSVPEWGFTWFMVRISHVRDSGIAVWILPWDAMELKGVKKVKRAKTVINRQESKKTAGATNGFKIANEEGYYFFLCLIILSFFFLLCVAILCFFLFLPQGTAELLIFPRKQGSFVITAFIIMTLHAEGQELSVRFWKNMVPSGI